MSASAIVSYLFYTEPDVGVLFDTYLGAWPLVPFSVTFYCLATLFCERILRYSVNFDAFCCKLNRTVL